MRPTVPHNACTWYSQGKHINEKTKHTYVEEIPRAISRRLRPKKSHCCWSDWNSETFSKQSPSPGSCKTSSCALTLRNSLYSSRSLVFWRRSNVSRHRQCKTSCPKHWWWGPMESWPALCPAPSYSTIQPCPRHFEAPQWGPLATTWSQGTGTGADRPRSWSSLLKQVNSMPAAWFRVDALSGWRSGEWSHLKAFKCVFFRMRSYKNSTDVNRTPDNDKALARTAVCHLSCPSFAYPRSASSLSMAFVGTIFF